MTELHLEGYLRTDNDGNAALKDETVAESVIDFAKYVAYGITWETENDLGESHAVIENVNLRIYATNNECTADEAMAALVDKMEGTCEVDTSLDGYSEWTITGMDVDKFTLGNHDIESILKSYMGKYIHFIMECKN